MSFSEFFDFDAACGESSETGPSSAAQNSAPSSSRDSSISPTKALQLDSSAPTETQDRLHCDPTETILGPSQGRMDDQQFQESSMMEPALPSEGNQSECSRTSQHPLRMIRCHWPSCVANHTLFQNDAEASVHFDYHQNEMLESWNGPTKCSWPNCSSSTLFKEKYLLKWHLTNIHIAPLRCSVAGCPRIQPFGKEYDLKRHVKEIHKPLRFFCPVESCKSNSIGFKRKYNLDKHISEEHVQVRCTLNHCGASILDGAQESHIKDAHDDYECAILACKYGSPSRFTMEAARLHLTRVHKMGRTPVRELFQSEDLLSRLRLDPGTFWNPHSIKKLQDCQGCLDSLPGAN